MTKKFGWCLTNTHDDCMQVADGDEDTVCDCECHEVEKKS